MYANEIFFLIVKIINLFAITPCLIENEQLYLSNVISVRVQDFKWFKINRILSANGFF